MITVYIVEDNKDIGALLQSIVHKNAEYEFSGLSMSGEDALKKIPELLPDVVLMDIGLPGMNGIDCVRQLKKECPSVEFIMCTVYDEDEKVFEALKAGATSYILKKSNPELLLNAIKEVYEGGSPMSSDIARKIVMRLQESNSDKVKLQFKISNREEEILIQLSKGYTYTEIADILFISVKTLKKHIYNIYEKLHVDNKVEALNKYFGKY